MVSPLELTKLGVGARIQRLGSLKYILVACFVLLTLGAAETWRYLEYNRCVSALEKKYVTAYQSLPTSEKKSVDEAEEIARKLLEALNPNQAETLTRYLASLNCRPQYRYYIFRLLSWLNPIGTAHAQIKIGGYTESDIRGIVIVSIFACMGLFFFIPTGHCCSQKVPRLSLSLWTA